MPTLIVFGGLPGTGKTSIARALVTRYPAAYLRIDAIEHALGEKLSPDEIGPAGYHVAYELARSNLALGTCVVADCVNPLAVTRDAWRSVAASLPSVLLEVEVVCSDKAIHRRRVETRHADMPNFVLPTWESVLRHDYAPWATARLVIDTAMTLPAAAAASILRSLDDRLTRAVVAAPPDRVDAP